MKRKSAIGKTDICSIGQSLLYTNETNEKENFDDWFILICIIPLNRGGYLNILIFEKNYSKGSTSFNSILSRNYFNSILSRAF